MRQYTVDLQSSNAAIRRAMQGDKLWYRRSKNGNWHVMRGRDVCLFGLRKSRTFRECRAFAFGYMLGAFGAITGLSEHDF